MANLTKRYLVLDSSNTALRPCDHGVHLPGLQSDKSPSFLKMESARAFADILAAKNKGNRFYLVEVMAVTVQYTKQEPGGEWVATDKPAE